MVEGRLVATWLLVAHAAFSFLMHSTWTSRRRQNQVRFRLAGFRSPLGLPCASWSTGSHQLLRQNLMILELTMAWIIHWGLLAHWRYTAGKLQIVNVRPMQLDQNR